MFNNTYAGFGVRVLASLIDGLVLFILTIIPVWFIYGNDYWTSDKIILGFWDFIFTWLIPTVGTVWLWVKFAATPGKMVFKLKVLDATTNEHLTVKQALIRYLGYIPSAVVLCLGFLWVAFDKRKQGWHDMMAGTVVVYGDHQS